MMTEETEKLIHKYWGEGFREGFKESFKETYKEGFQEGKETARTACKLLSRKYTVKEVMEKTGLNKEDVEALK